MHTQAESKAPSWSRDVHHDKALGSVHKGQRLGGKRVRAKVLGQKMCTAQAGFNAQEAWQFDNLVPTRQDDAKKRHSTWHMAPSLICVHVHHHPLSMELCFAWDCGWDPYLDQGIPLLLFCKHSASEVAVQLEVQHSAQLLLRFVTKQCALHPACGTTYAGRRQGETSDCLQV